jgi:hypothetical protein
LRPRDVRATRAGALAFGFNAYAALQVDSDFASGQHAGSPCWNRDAEAPPSANSTNALEFVLAL